MSISTLSRLPMSSSPGIQDWQSSLRQSSVLPYNMTLQEAFCHELTIFMTSTQLRMATMKAVTIDPNHPALLNAPTLHIRMLRPTPILSCCRLRCLGLSIHFQGPIAPCVLFLGGKSQTYIHPSIPVGPHEGHVTCHWRCPKEWLKGVVATTLSGYCLFDLFSFPCFHDLLS